MSDFIKIFFVQVSSVPILHWSKIYSFLCIFEVTSFTSFYLKKNIWKAIEANNYTWNKYLSKRNIFLFIYELFLSQVIDNFPTGRVKVWWVDGHTSMCWPQDLYKVI